jgi:hypothetical protein
MNKKINVLLIILGAAIAVPFFALHSNKVDAVEIPPSKGDYVYKTPTETFELTWNGTADAINGNLQETTTTGKQTSVQNYPFTGNTSTSALNLIYTLSSIKTTGTFNSDNTLTLLMHNTDGSQSHIVFSSTSDMPLPEIDTTVAAKQEEDFTILTKLNNAYETLSNNENSLQLYDLSSNLQELSADCTLMQNDYIIFKNAMDAKQYLVAKKDCYPVLDYDLNTTIQLDTTSFSAICANIDSLKQTIISDSEDLKNLYATYKSQNNTTKYFTDTQIQTLLDKTTTDLGACTSKIEAQTAAVTNLFNASKVLLQQAQTSLQTVPNQGVDTNLTNTTDTGNTSLN